MKIKLLAHTSMYLWALLCTTALAQTPVIIHSHNDYQQTVPFYQAYAQRVNMIEADVFPDNTSDQLLVAHDSLEVNRNYTLNELYIFPIVKQFKLNGARLWKNSNRSMSLLIDIKHDHKKVIPSLVKALNAFPDIFNTSINSNSVQVIVTGDIPQPEQFKLYPEFISFDGRPDINYTESELKRVAFISDNFSKYTTWNGKGSIKPSEKEAVIRVINKAHDMNKMIRFWGCPDNLNTWQTFREMQIDIINTDKPEKCSDFFSKEQQHNFSFGKRSLKAKVTTIRPEKLDNATRNFEGFADDNLSLDTTITAYKPTGKNDGKQTSPKNVILLIGDGMGVAQWAAADLVNGGLTISQLKHIGFQRTQAKANFITDSAGAGSAIATGKKTPNRAIASDGNGKSNPSLTEILLAQNVACGIVTNGNLADATPAAFYAHTDERDNVDEITSYLTKVQPHFLAGSGHSLFTNRKDGRNLFAELAPDYQFLDSINQQITNNKKIIVLDERLNEATSRKNLDLLSKTTAKAIEQLARNSKGFFLMVEGAKIDYAGHANAFPASIIETLGFDLAVQQAIRFADTDGETLVIVTADHETGGLSLIGGDPSKRTISGVYSTDDHTPIFVPVMAYGPGANKFIGVYENTEISKKIMQLINK